MGERVRSSHPSSPTQGARLPITLQSSSSLHLSDSTGYNGEGSLGSVHTALARRARDTLPDSDRSPLHQSADYFLPFHLPGPLVRVNNPGCAPMDLLVAHYLVIAFLPSQSLHLSPYSSLSTPFVFLTNHML